MSTTDDDDAAAPDFDAAEIHLRAARIAHDDGDDVRFIAARKLVMVALGVLDEPHPHPRGIRTW